MEHPLKFQISISVDTIFHFSYCSGENRAADHNVPPTSSSSRSPSFSETERRPDPILPFQAEMRDVRERINRVDRTLDSLMAGSASQSEQEELASGELERFISDTLVRFYHARSLEEAYWENQRRESARQDAEIASMQARIDALEQQNQRLKRMGRGAGGEL